MTDQDEIREAGERKTLPITFAKNGFFHSQVRREGQLAIYERTKDDGRKPQFEVVRIREHAAFKLGAETIPAGEHYPSASAWGRDGFTCLDREEADAKFKELAS